MFKFEHKDWTEEYLDENVEVTKEILELAEMFKKKLDFRRSFTTRALKILKKYECETIGDAYMLLYHCPENIGAVTKREILSHVLHSFMPAKYAIEVDKAYLLSSRSIEDIKPMRYYSLHYFHNRQDTGFLYIKTKISLSECKNNDDFLQQLVDENKLDTAKADSIIEFEEIDKRTYEERTKYL